MENVYLLCYTCVIVLAKALMDDIFYCCRTVINIDHHQPEMALSNHLGKTLTWMSRLMTPKLCTFLDLLIIAISQAINGPNNV